MTTSLIAHADNQKLRGGYYTPEVIARFLANWAICSASDEVLEPSCGDGSLLEAAARRLLQLGASATQVNRQVRATELYESEAVLARRHLEHLGIPSADIVTVSDFFASDDQAWGMAGEPCDVVLGNPPFLRHFPRAVVAFMVVVPEPRLGEPQQSAMVETLEGLARRQRVEDADFMAEAISLIVWDPTDGSSSSETPAPASPLRFEKFSLQVETAYVSRYKGLPPHAA